MFQGFFVVISRKVPQCFKFQVKLMSAVFRRRFMGVSREFQGYLKEVKEVSGVFRECFKKVQRIFKVFQQRKFTGWLKVD